MEFMPWFFASGLRSRHMAEGSDFHKTLIYYPIIHTQTDMGNLKASIRHLMLKKAGLQAIKRKAERVERIWTEIELSIHTMRLDFRKVRLYQDALPICGREPDIIRDLAGKGSRNHQLLLKLMERGATLMGTESPPLLLAEYENIKRVIDAEKSGMEDGGRKTETEKSAQKILSDRDRFIARRISETLMPTETGVIFLGLLHDPEAFLPTDIRTVYPLHRPVRGNRT
jgi:hypothetical protein